MAIHGPVCLLHSDQGINYVGSCRKLKLKSENPELMTYIQNDGSKLL